MCIWIMYPDACPTNEMIIIINCIENIWKTVTLDFVWNSIWLNFLKSFCESKSENGINNCAFAFHISSFIYIKRLFLILIDVSYEYVLPIEIRSKPYNAHYCRISLSLTRCTRNKDKWLNSKKSAKKKKQLKNWKGCIVRKSNILCCFDDRRKNRWKKK